MLRAASSDDAPAAPQGPRAPAKPAAGDDLRAGSEEEEEKERGRRWRWWVCRRTHRAAEAAPRAHAIRVVARIGCYLGGSWCELEWADEGRGRLRLPPTEWRNLLPERLAAAQGMRGVEGLAACDCFCGLGGWGYALNSHRVVTRWCADYRTDRLRLHAANHPQVKCIRIDFHNEREAKRLLAGERMCEVAVISSPCQGFSTRNKGDEGRALLQGAAPRAGRCAKRCL